MNVLVPGDENEYDLHCGELQKKIPYFERTFIHCISATLSCFLFLFSVSFLKFFLSFFSF